MSHANCWIGSMRKLASVRGSCQRRMDFQFRCGLGVYDANTNSQLEPCFPTLLKEDFMSDVAKNIVLVHGAFADGSSWSKVIPLLQEKGYHAVAVQNPLTSLADEVAFTKRIIALQDGPVLLVGHSWGAP